MSTAGAGRSTPRWAHRTLLLRGYDTLSDRGKARLQAVFDLDGPTDELSAAWGVKSRSGAF